MPSSFATRAVAVCVVIVLLALALRMDRTAPAQDSKSGPETGRIVPPRRVPWTTSKVTGSPDPPPRFRSIRVFPEVTFHHPLLFARCPGTDRLFVGEQEGMIYSIANRADAKKETFFDTRKELKSIGRLAGASGLGELYGLVFHPKFEENRHCYVCYTLNAKVPPKDGRFPDGTRVSRFTVTRADPPRIDPDSEEIVITFMGGGHNGGDLHFGPDGMLYISTGDAASPSPPDPLNTGQDCSDLLSSVLRIDVGKKDPGKNYSVPKDNPFVDRKDVRPEIWAYGFRNPWRMSFDRKTGELWLGDVGWELWEMVHKIEKGGNYGWSITEARQPIKPAQQIGPTPIRPAMIEVSHTLGASVTGGYVYRGRKFPELNGAYVFGDWETRRIWAARFENDRLTEMPEIVKPNVRVSAFGEDNNGELYYFDYDSGVMYTLARNDGAAANARFPTRLSDTGLFKNVKVQDPADGVVAFMPNAQQWQDGASARWYIALPGTSSVALFEYPRAMPGQVYWHRFQMHFPLDAVLVKTIYLDVIHGDREERRKIETQILHCDGEDWRGYTYAWRDDQSDADLVGPDGGEKTFTVKPWFAREQKHERVWTFHSRSQCMSCHNAWAEYALGFTLGQLNNARARGDGPASQLVAFTEAGIIRRIGAKDKPLPPFTEATAGKVAVVSDPFGGAYTLDERARGYLHANCAHCHRFGGGGGQVVLELDRKQPLKEMGILDVRPRQGDFGIPEARIVAPGDPRRSVLLYRMGKFGSGRMPHLGSEFPHPSGVELVHAWVHSLGKGAVGNLEPPRTAEGIEPALTRLELALPFARALGENRLAPADRDRVLASVARLAPGPVRDLFEGYLPPDPRGRKLGSNPRPISILALNGDPRNGESLFFSKDLKCADCHKVGDRGKSVGPDLTTIGKTRTRAELLDSLLHPSARIDTPFAAYLVRTKDEKTLTGLLVTRDDRRLIIRDAENKEHALATADLETITPSRLSLMPDGQLSGLRPQEAADLLDYLSSRK